MYMKSRLAGISIIISCLISSMPVVGQSAIIVCDKIPVETIQCETDIGTDQFLEPVFHLQSEKSDTSWEKQICFILTSQDFWHADSVTFQVLVESEQYFNKMELLDSYKIKVEPDWQYCWKAWTFYEPGVYSVYAYIGNKFVAGGVVNINTMIK